MHDDFWEGSCLELHVVKEYDRRPSSSEGEKGRELDGWVDEPYSEIISDVVSRYEGSALRSS